MDLNSGRLHAFAFAERLGFLHSIGMKLPDEVKPVYKA